MRRILPYLRVPPRFISMLYEKNDDAKAPSALTNELSVCWSCHGPRPENALFCPTCECVQPPGQGGHFSRLGLEPTFDIDIDELERRYFERQRLLHPDRFIGKSAREKAFSQQQAASLNEAYETLKHPLSRAGYLLHEKGCGVLHEGCNLVTDEKLLIETMEMREALAEADTADEINALTNRAADDIKACIEQLSGLFANNDLEGACMLVTRLKYLNKLEDEARQHRARMGIS